jgi:uncharacterized caspase-like protein
VARIGRKCSATWGVLKARDRLSRASPTLPASGRRRSCGLIARAAIAVAASRRLLYTGRVSLIRDSMDRRGFISGLAVAAALASVMSASAVADGRRVALVIGNGAYRSVPALPNPPNDAGDVTAALKRLGFEVTLITNASFDEMRRALIALGRDAAGADMATVYFGGHGMEINGENWLIPVDAELKRDTDAANEAISLRSVMMQVSSTMSLGLVILDACRNNPFAAKMNRSLAVRAVASGGLGRIEPLGNVLVAYAARDGTTALDGNGRNSPFTAALLRNIETPGVEVTFVFRNIRDDVMEATRNEQQPFVYGSLSRKAIYLVGQPPPGSASMTEANAMPAVRGSGITGALGHRHRSRAGGHLGDHGAQRPRPITLDLADDGRRHLQIPRRGRPRHATT